MKVNNTNSSRPAQMLDGFLTTSLLALALMLLFALSSCGARDDTYAVLPLESPPEATHTPEPTPEAAHVPVQENVLIGTWAWDALNKWQYNFHADGEGTRGIAADMETFRWRTHGDNLFIETDGMEESWIYVLDGDVLTIAAGQIDGIEYSYIRVVDGVVVSIPNIQTADESMRGIWDGDVYTSEYLGLSFTLADGWNVHNEAEIADVLDIAEGIISDAGAYIPANADVFTDMTVSNAVTGANVQILFERLPFYVTEQEYIEMAAKRIELIGGLANANSGTNRIGSYDWYSLDTEMDFGIIVYGRQFITIQDGFVRSIIISYVDGSETPEDILLMFDVMQ